LTLIFVFFLGGEDALEEAADDAEDEDEETEEVWQCGFRKSESTIFFDNSLI
jgi:hypothetical protein